MAFRSELEIDAYAGRCAVAAAAPASASGAETTALVVAGSSLGLIVRRDLSPARQIALRFEDHQRRRAAIGIFVYRTSRTFLVTDR